MIQEKLEKLRQELMKITARKAALNNNFLKNKANGLRNAIIVLETYLAREKQWSEFS